MPQVLATAETFANAPFGFRDVSKSARVAISPTRRYIADELPAFQICPSETATWLRNTPS
jgi:hypothetical protein